MLTLPPDPWPDLLAAYADGELDAATRREVEAWLAAHPDARELLAGQQLLGPVNERLWSAVAPPMPTAAAWDQTTERIHSRVRTTRRRWWPWLASGAAAASVVLMLWSGRPIPAPTMVDEEPLLVLAEGDVDIHDLPGDALGMVVVGHPHPEPLALAAAHEWTLHAVAPDADGMVPPAALAGDSKIPMIVAPLGR